MDQSIFFRTVSGGWVFGWGIKRSVIPAGKVCPHIKTMKMMMILFKTIKVMSGAQNKVRIITSKQKKYLTIST